MPSVVNIKENELQSKTIDWLRFPLVVLVLFGHINPLVDMQSANLSLYDIFGTLISKTLGHLTISCFFMFSGYLFFVQVKEWSRTVYFTKMKKRLRTLLLPYVLFNVLAISVQILKMILKDDGTLYPFLNDLSENWYRILWNYKWVEGYTVNMLGQPLQMCFTPYLIPLWFMRELMVMVVISPIVYYLVKYTKVFGVVVLGLCYYTNIWIEIPGYSAQFFLTAFFFFSLGAFFSVNGKNMVVSLRKYQIVWFVISLITMFLSVYFYGTDYKAYFLPIFILSGVISVINITSYFMERGKLRVSKTLSKATFFIYLTHDISILYYTTLVFNKIIGTDSTMQLLAIYFVTPFVCAGVILCIYVAMQRFFPKLLGLCVGNR